MAREVLHFTVNGSPVEVFTQSNRTLLEVLREEVGLTGTKEGCGTGDCGACTVIVNGRTVCACCMVAMEAEGKEVITIEGLAQDGQLHPVQRAFIEYGALQCGFCIPGMILSAKVLLDQNPHPTEHEIRRGIAGNLCRCTGYTKIVEAITAVAQAS